MKRLILIYLLSINSLILFSQDDDLPLHFKELAENNLESVFWKGGGTEKLLAMTFDDGPVPTTSAILDLLDKYQVKASFFWQGSNLVKYPEIVWKAIKAGHQLGNHSWDHPDCSALSSLDLWNNQLLPTFRLYDSLFSIRPEIYRPPFGGMSDEQAKFLSGKNITTVLWSVSTYDWDRNRNSSEEICKIIEKDLHPESILLLHDVSYNKNDREKIKAVECIIKYARKEGYQFVTVSELINKNR